MTPEPESFLNVERSVTGCRWVDRLDAAAARLAGAIATQSALPEITARILAGRGVGPEGVADFLNPTLRTLMPDPSTLAGMDELASRLADAILARDKVALFGDYDVDGAASVALVARYLRHFGVPVVTHIPDRIFEGYGPNIDAMESLVAQGARLIVTLDCGTTSLEPIAHARARGADVLVVDHHLPGLQPPPATALVNPNRADDISGLGHLCAAGVAFMVLVAVNRVLRQRGEQGLPDLMGLVDLVALATVCDVVPLVGLNRAFVLRGLDLLRSGGNPGLKTLAIAARLTGPVECHHLGYLLGPRINAGGRIGDAGLGALLLSTENEAEAQAIAARLDALNAERQSIEAGAVEEASAAAEAEIGEGEGPAVLITASPNWHQGVVGLVAARLRERFDRPAFAVALKPDGTGTGSGRSMPGVDLGAAVLAAVAGGVADKGGGHAMAAGVTLAPGRLGDFRAFMNQVLEPKVRAARRRSAVRIDAALTARAATPDFVAGIERAGPFGSGNPTPVFAFPAHEVRFPEIVGAGGHIRFSLAAGDGARLKSIAFRAAGTPLGEAILQARDGGRLHLCGCLSVDRWQGRETVQLRVIDAAVPA